MVEMWEMREGGSRPLEIKSVCVYAYTQLHTYTHAYTYVRKRHGGKQT